MSYEKRHVLDFIIDDEQTSTGREIRVSVDTLEKVIIEIGNSITIRTDESGIDDLRDALYRACVALEKIRYERVDDLLEQATEDINPPMQKERSASHRDEAWDPNDPANW